MQTRIPELLTFARERGRLDELEEAARKQWLRSPSNPELTALVALARFAQNNRPGAVEAAEAWDKCLEMQKQRACYPEGYLIALACLEMAETRPLGHKLTQGVLQEATARGWTDLQQTVLARSTWAYVEDDNAAEAEAIVRRLVDLLETDPSLNRKPGIDPAAARVYRLAALAGHVHPSLLPTVLQVLGERVANGIDKIKQPSLIASSLAEVVPRVSSQLTMEQRRQVRDAIAALVFPFGPDHAPALGLWKEDSMSGLRGSLAGLVIDLAKSAGDVSQLRRAWDEHPEANTLDVLTLRAEAALADGDVDAAGQLLARIEGIRRETGLEPMLWSEWFLFRGFRERLTTEFHQDFRGGKFDERALEIIGNDATQFVKREADGLHISLPAGAGKQGAVGVASRFQLRGDFEITASFELIDAVEPARLASMILYVDFPEAGNLASIQRVRRDGEGNAYALHALISRLGRTDRWERSFPTDSRTGKLRIVRRGSKLCFLVAEGPGGEFRLLHRADCNTSDVRAIRAVVDVQTAATQHAVDLRWLDLTVRAEEIPGLASQSSAN